MSQTIGPFLMFQERDAETAMTVYVSPFADSEILDIERHGALRDRAAPTPLG